MSKGSQFTDYVLDQLQHSGAIRSRSMFGGTGVYVDEVFCAIITRAGRFCLRVDDSNRADFEAEGMQQFPRRGDTKMPYFEVPLHVLEDSDELRVWTRKARQAALAASASKKPRAKKVAKARAAAAAGKKVSKQARAAKTIRKKLGAATKKSRANKSKTVRKKAAAGSKRPRAKKA